MSVCACGRMCVERNGQGATHARLRRQLRVLHFADNVSANRNAMHAHTHTHTHTTTPHTHTHRRRQTQTHRNKNPTHQHPHGSVAGAEDSSVLHSTLEHSLPRHLNFVAFAAVVARAPWNASSSSRKWRRSSACCAGPKQSTPEYSRVPRTRDYKDCRR